MGELVEGKPYVLDILEEIQKERKRLEKIIASPEFKHNQHRWGWMLSWLAKSNEEHYKTWWNRKCNVCGKKSKIFY